MVLIPTVMEIPMRETGVIVSDTEKGPTLFLPLKVSMWELGSMDAGKEWENYSSTIISSRANLLVMR